MIKFFRKSHFLKSGLNDIKASKALIWHIFSLKAIM